MPGLLWNEEVEIKVRWEGERERKRGRKGNSSGKWRKLRDAVIRT